MCPDQEFSVDLKNALAETHSVGVVREEGRYVNQSDLARFLRIDPSEA